MGRAPSPASPPTGGVDGCWMPFVCPCVCVLTGPLPLRCWHQRDAVTVLQSSCEPWDLSKQYVLPVARATGLKQLFKLP
jgi:hypothetical protein